VISHQKRRVREKRKDKENCGTLDGRLDSFTKVKLRGKTKK
jgi:hypothetical protein